MKKNEYCILVLIILALIYHYNSKSANEIDNIPVVVNPEPAPVVVPVVPDEPDIIKDPYKRALDQASKLNKNLLAIFTADWCGYCRSLKKDLPILDTSSYLIYEIDIDDKNNKDVKNRFDINSLPCSVIIDPKLDKEIKRKSGYSLDEYKIWLRG